MAFKTLQTSVSLLLFSACLNIITDIRIAAISIREKCQCVEETDSVQWKKITDYTIIQKDPLCNKVQIILQLSNKQTCLNPDSTPGAKITKMLEKDSIQHTEEDGLFKTPEEKRIKKAKEELTILAFPVY